jgi:pimeloyl-ACP methyl ester carboxylesterase
VTAVAFLPKSARAEPAAANPAKPAPAKTAPAVAKPPVKPEPAKPAPAADKSAKKEKDKLPEKKELLLQTNDGMTLTLTYYPGTKGKESVPVVLLHAWKRNRTDFKDLAPALQAVGCAVIVPDLRGHGESKHTKYARKDEALDAAKFSPQQFGVMVTSDMLAIKNFLWEKNNAGELNLDKLCVVGAEMGASVAVNFAIADALDQGANRVLQPAYKLGRFVKALVLISPEMSFKGLPIRPGNARLIADVSLLIFVGKQDKKAYEEAKRIYGIFERYHPEPVGLNKNEERTLYFAALDTKLQSAKLLDPKLNVAGYINEFIQRRLIKSEPSREWMWMERKIPHAK